VIYKTGFWIRWLDLLYLIHSYVATNYRAIADLHTSQFNVTQALGFSVFTSRILATDLSQSHWNFKSHIKSSLQSLIHFLPFLLSHLGLPSPELDQFLTNNRLQTSLLIRLLNTSLWPLFTDHAENTASVVKEVCVLNRWIYWTFTDPWLQVVITLSLIHTFNGLLEDTSKSSQSAVSSPVLW
jgi:hypothetical protein